MTHSIVATVVFASWALVPRVELTLCGASQGDAQYWIDNAETIVRTRAVEQRGRRLTIEEARALFAKGDAPSTRTGTTVRFEVIETLKGTAPASLEFDGELTDLQVMDENEADIPRRWVRKGGRGGNCYALHYRAGEEYLLIMKARNGSLSPYWAAMGATNEHLEGPGDPWLRWVRDYLARRNP